MDGAFSELAEYRSETVPILQQAKSQLTTNFYIRPKPLPEPLPEPGVLHKQLTKVSDSVIGALRDLTDPTTAPDALTKNDRTLYLGLFILVIGFVILIMNKL